MTTTTALPRKGSVLRRAARQLVGLPPEFWAEHDAFQAALKHTAARATGDVPGLLAALRVALDLHQPALRGRKCEGCGEQWPCTEYTGIRDAVMAAATKRRVWQQPTPPREHEQDCPHCGTRQHKDALWCYCCNGDLPPLREVEDWNPTPAEWFAAVGQHVTRLAREDPNVARAVIGLAAAQGQPLVAHQILGAPTP